MVEQTASTSQPAPVDVSVGCDENEIEKSVDAELDGFDQWCSSNLNGGMINVERAILKTYLMWRLHPKVRE